MAQKKKRKKRRGHPGRIFLVSMLFAALFIACIYGAYTFMVDSSPYINASPTPGVQSAVSPSPSVQPTPSLRPSPSARVRESAEPDDEEEYGSEPERTPSGEYTEEVLLSTYEDDTYGFACPYPENFEPDGLEGEGVQLSLTSSDGSAYQYIIADDSPADTPAMDMRAFLSEHPSAIIEENRSGSDYYYILINENGMYIYRYAAYSDGSAKGFEFGYTESAADMYAGYPDDIRADFMLY